MALEDVYSFHTNSQNKRELIQSGSSEINVFQERATTSVS